MLYKITLCTKIKMIRNVIVYFKHVDGTLNTYSVRYGDFKKQISLSSF